MYTLIIRLKQTMKVIFSSLAHIASETGIYVKWIFIYKEDGIPLLHAICNCKRKKKQDLEN